MAEVASMPKSPVPLDTIPVSPNGDIDADNERASTNGSSEVVTVFHDAENFNVKHPLAHTWTLWFTKPPNGKVRVPRDLTLRIDIDSFTARLERITQRSHQFQHR